MNEYASQDKESWPNIRSFQYDVLLKNLREQDPEMFRELQLAAEAEASGIHDKQAFVHGFLYHYGIRSEEERTALLERIFLLEVTDTSDDDADEDSPRSGEPGAGQSTA